MSPCVVPRHDMPVAEFPVVAHARRFAVAAITGALLSMAVPHGAQAQLFGGAPALASMLERVTPAVVNIAVIVRLEKSRSPLVLDPVLGPLVPEGPYRFDTGQSGGSGVIIDAQRGLVVSNHHVIARAQSIKVVLRDRREFEAQLVGSDPATDIALLRIAPDDLTAMAIANSDRVRIGESVVAIGNPFGLGQTVTAGIVSALGRSMRLEGYEEFIQTDAPINPGNSGGALTNMQGELMGINTAILSPGGTGNVGIGFAVPANTMTAVVEQILRHGEVRRGKVGLAADDVTPALAKARDLRVREGAMVTRVEDGAPAQRAGLRVGDVVTAVNGRPVASQSALRNRLALIAVGETAEVEYLRGSSRGTARVEVAPVVAPATKSASVDFRQLPGARMSDHPAGGISVLAVEPASASHALGLRDGDVIDSANREPIRNLGDLGRALDQSPMVFLGIIRGETKVQLRYSASY